MENVEMWCHKNINPIHRSRKTEHFEAYWDSKKFFLGHLFHSNFPRLKSFDMTDKCHFCLTASCWAKSFVKTWMLPIFQCMEYKWLTGQKDVFLEKKISFFQSVHYHMKDFSFTEYNLISKKVIENADAYYPHNKRYI